ncbi:Transcriptional regulator, TetR family [[Actinomadura] parvosata subsp. kistnae]|uniref:TetR family transcriptional regulator n=1 Tax=[Actinomadura] parvosata subsp. kistnae TaxID=1909395 RepID=A0A1U9ZXG9_9ACTN|nr:TetR/AcrR family transcriptional regulator [Nonomuraea sp. ATCC 55076]AQZ62609.1 TetR family transcriptional regulator [Nonomuraea sp. ATCC 55076]SPL88893.1 Transcriptional regulator, TetR family [Actinomadura parvosata subsp. kistnae]
MGRKGDETRGRLLDATQDLIEAGGYFGAGLNQVIAASGMPRGSLYFHFPDGKDQLVTETLRRAGRELGQAMRDLADTAPDAPSLVAGVIALLGDRLEGSGWRKGCPVATVALEMAAGHDALRQVCAEVYDSWEDALRERLVADGHPGAEDVATTVLALVEGALLLARARRSREPLDRAARSAALLLAC